MSLPILLINVIIKTTIPTYFFPHLTSALDNSVIFSTPINSYKTLKEGWFLLSKLNVNPYDALINHPPLVLQLLSTIDMDNDLLMNFIFAIVDTLVLYNVIKLRAKSQRQVNDDSIIWCYLLNPLIILSGFSKNSIIFTNLFLLQSINNLIDKSYKLALVQLSIASYLSYFPIYLIIPFLNHIYRHTHTNPFKYFTIFVMALVLLSLNNFNFNFNKVFNNCYSSVVKFEKIQPNIGLWWYFFIEIFDFFHDFYIVVFNMYSFVFIIPFTYKLGSKNSLFNILICILWINFSKNYPTIGDLNLSTILILTLAHNHLNRLRLPLLLSAIILTVVLVLLVLFYYLWVNLSSGNSNFFYGVGLVYSILSAWTICDLIWAELQIQWFEKNQNKSLKQDEQIKLTQF